MTDSKTGLAVVMGSGGGIGAAMLARLQRDAAYAQALGLSRNTEVRVDYLDEASLAAAAQWVAGQCAATGLELRLLIVATGFLHGDQGQPERSFNHLDAAYLQHVFAINTIGPALVMKHFLPLLPKSGRCVAGFVSAKAGLKVRPAEEAASACRVSSVLGSWPKQYVRKQLLNS